MLCFEIVLADNLRTNEGRVAYRGAHKDRLSTDFNIGQVQIRCIKSLKVSTSCSRRDEWRSSHDFLHAIFLDEEMVGNGT